MKKKKLLFNNTYESGAITYIIFKEKDKYIGVCLEFDLIAEATTKKEAGERIEDYSRAWLENVRQNKLPEVLLNRPAPKKYWKMYEHGKLEERERKIQSNIVKISSHPVAHSYQPYTPQFPLYA